MKASGIIRHVDELGRIVIPLEIRRRLCITEGTPMELFLDDLEDDTIIFKKYDCLEGPKEAIKRASKSINENENLSADIRHELLLKMGEALEMLDKKKG